jgi:hypothetical protein
MTWPMDEEVSLSLVKTERTKFEKYNKDILKFTFYTISCFGSGCQSEKQLLAVVLTTLGRVSKR